MGLKLVIVDDAPFIREAVRNLVAKTDIELVGEASDGIEGVKVVLRNEPDVVLMDLVLPHKNGIEASIQILEQLPNVKIIACSTLEEKNFILKAMDAGCCDFIAKPFEADKLIQLIYKVGKK